MKNRTITAFLVSGALTAFAGTALAESELEDAVTKMDEAAEARAKAAEAAVEKDKDKMKEMEAEAEKLEAEAKEMTE